MNFFGIGLPEMAVIAAIGLLVFGPKRLPELGKTLAHLEGVSIGFHRIREGVPYGHGTGSWAQSRRSEDRGSAPCSR